MGGSRALWRVLGGGCVVHPVLCLNAPLRPSTTWRTSSLGRASRPRYSLRVSAAAAPHMGGGGGVGGGPKPPSEGWSPPPPAALTELQPRGWGLRGVPGPHVKDGSPSRCPGLCCVPELLAAAWPSSWLLSLRSWLLSLRSWQLCGRGLGCCCRGPGCCIAEVLAAVFEVLAVAWPRPWLLLPRSWQLHC